MNLIDQATTHTGAAYAVVVGIITALGGPKIIDFVTAWLKARDEQKLRNAQDQKDERAESAEERRVEWTGYEGYSKRLETRMDMLEARYEKRISELEDVIKKKDGVISELQAKASRQEEAIREIRHLIRNVQTIQDLRIELERMEGTAN